MRSKEMANDFVPDVRPQFPLGGAKDPQEVKGKD